MRVFLRLVLPLLLIVVGGLAGFLSATTLRPHFDALASQITGNLVTNESKGLKILYYRNPMGLPDTSPVPKKDSMGMDYIPVYEEATGAQASTGEPKVLYYRNPMGLPDTSPVPKKDPMGMDYIPVYEDAGSAPDPSIVKVNVEKVQRAGVKTELVIKRVLEESLRVPGSIQLDERRERSITLRAEGFVEEVYAGATGQHVKAGEPLFRFYSPQILQAAVEYRLAAAGGQERAGARKLLNLGLPESYIKSIPLKGELSPSLDWLSPVDGVLMKKNVVVGVRSMPGDELYRLADVSTVWVIADVPEQDVGRIKTGDKVTVSVLAYPGQIFTGDVAFILPELNAETRTASVRVELPNPDHKLLHGMFADVVINTARSGEVIAVPASAIIDSGNRQVAIVQFAEGQFKPKEVKLGRRGAGFVEVLEGLSEGELVVTRANFLIDAESNLQAALAALTSTAEGVQ
jgi:Cu(I)/Ag(I) efflux system membrane fusion protein